LKRSCMNYCYIKLMGYVVKLLGEWLSSFGADQFWKGRWIFTLYGMEINCENQLFHLSDWWKGFLTSTRDDIMCNERLKLVRIRFYVGSALNQDLENRNIIICLIKKKILIKNIIICLEIINILEKLNY